MTGFLEAPVIESSGSYQIANSLRLRKSASAYIARTFASAGSRTTWTWRACVKRGELGTAQILFATDNSNRISFGMNTVDAFEFEVFNGAGSDYFIASSALLRDPSAHYDLMVVWDSTNATVADRQRMYINGVRITSFSSTGNTVPSSALSNMNNAIVHNIGRSPVPLNYFDGLMSDVYFIDGQALTPTSFGQFNADGVWTPKPYFGAYGANGFYLKFNDSSSLTNLCLDRSGNGNNWTATNVSLTAGPTYDCMSDTPTNNFAVVNAVRGTPSGGTGNVLLTAGNLNAAQNALAYVSGSATMGFTSGQWYWEFRVGAIPQVLSLGIAIDTWVGGLSAGSLFYHLDGTKYLNGANSAYGAAYTTGDTIGFAMDFVGGNITCYKNGVSQGVLAALSTPVYYPAVTLYNTGNGDFNFGQRPFTYTPPTGFKALCTANLPAAVIPDGRKHFDVKTHTGNNTSLNITGVAFKPDLAWVKSRSNAYSHILMDAVRGAGKQLSSDTTAAEVGNANDLITAFNSDGITVNTNFAGGSNASTNGLGSTFVDWLWKAGGAAVTNNSGSISAQVSANTAAGFSIVTYTGAGLASSTVGHGLGVAPSMIIVKERSTNVSGWNAWAVYHRSVGATGVLFLNTTAGTTVTANAWNNTAPTSAAFTVAFNTGAGVNYNSNYVAYCFAEISGASKFGSYTGNGSADGPFVQCGFRPRFLLVKRTDTSDDWFFMDAARNPSNLVSNSLRGTGAFTLLEESGNSPCDFLANGFKIRNSGGGFNTNAANYIFAAFAENPFGGRNVAPATAR